jgi:fatty acid desaturase
VNIHLAHHLFTSVPFYNLPKLHKRLMLEPYYQNESQRYDTYFSSKDCVFADLLKMDAGEKKDPDPPETVPPVLVK